jgi:Replication-relaxation
MPALTRARRIGAERVFELARHLTERDREVALCLYNQQVLTTGQLALLFFSSRRRAQDRLLFLYRQRVLDRFYPVSRFGAGKPQAHWLLDEAGAHLVAASLDLDRKQLAWRRREDWGSHPQLAHRLEVNRFVTDLVAATLADPTLGLAAWFGPRQAAARMGEKMRGTLRPDAELFLTTPAGPVDLLLEWDRGTETLERLEEKLRRYRTAERKLYDYPGPRSILVVVPGKRRLDNLRELCRDLGEGSWPVLATTATQLRAAGPLASIWQRLDTGQLTCSLIELPPRRNLRGANLDPANALGRRWRHQHPGFWDRLSPLGRRNESQSERPHVAPAADAASDTNPAEMRHTLGSESPQTRDSGRFAESGEGPAARPTGAWGPESDLPLSEMDGFMDDPEPDEEGSWR